MRWRERPEIAGVTAVLLSVLWFAVLPQSAAADVGYVSDSNADSLLIIDTATNAVTGSVHVAAHPSGVAVTPDGSRIYVTSPEADTVTVVAADDRSSDEIAVVGRPEGVAVSPNGERAYVALRDGNAVAVIDTSTSSLIGEPVAVSFGPTALAVTPDGATIVVANTLGNSVSIIRDSDLSVVGDPIEVGAMPSGVAIIGTRAFVANGGDDAGGSVSVVDLGSLDVDDTIPVGIGAVAIVATRDGRALYVANSGSDTVSVIDAGSRSVADTIDVGPMPSSLAVITSGRRVYVANAGALAGGGSLSIIDVGSGSAGTPIALDANPRGIAFAAGGGTAGGPCRGDCNGDRQVHIGELVLSVQIALSREPLSDCPVLDANSNDKVDVDELVDAVNRAINGCPPAP